MNVLVLGHSGFAQAVVEEVKRRGGWAGVHLTVASGNYGPESVGAEIFPASDNPAAIAQQHKVDLVIPASIDWHRQPWKDDLHDAAPVFSPFGKAMMLERYRDMGMQLAQQHAIAVPYWHLAARQQDAIEFARESGEPWVFKNPKCSPSAPLHTVVPATLAECLEGLGQANDTDGGIFLQQHIGADEIGHIAFVSGGKAYPVVTNQEYKKPQEADIGNHQDYPMGGLAEADPGDKYGLCAKLITPLEKWFKKVDFRGPVQVTAGWHEGKWKVMEYNVRIGVSTGPLMINMMDDPLAAMLAVAKGEQPVIRFQSGKEYGGIVTLARKIADSAVRTKGPGQGFLWWHRVADRNGELVADEKTERVADVAAVGASLDECFKTAYGDLAALEKTGLRWRSDIGKTLWPPAGGRP
jgi:phosphoribosylamine-glycine ligase